MTGTYLHKKKGFFQDLSQNLKKSALIKYWENIIAHKEKFERSEAVRNKCGLLKKSCWSGGTAREKVCSFYCHLSLNTLFQAFTLTQNYCINVNISFLEYWQFNHKFALSILHTYYVYKTVLTISQNIKVRGIEKSQFSYSLLNWKKVWKCSLS